jgi:hypothetical protein
MGPFRTRPAPLGSRVVHIRVAFTRKSRLNSRRSGATPMRSRTGTMAVMHRICALLLLSVTSFLLAAPAIGPDAETHLPPCCRAKGKHRCALEHARTGQRGIHGIPFAVVGTRCPMFPKTGAVATGPQAFLPRASEFRASAVVTRSAIHKGAEVRFRFPFDGTCPKRGPPSALFATI